MTTIPQSLTDAWNAATNAQTPQEFMDISRQRGAHTINEAVLSYIAEWPFDVRLSEDEAQIIYDRLTTYLGLTEGEEWN